MGAGLQLTGHLSCSNQHSVAKQWDPCGRWSLRTSLTWDQCVWWHEGITSSGWSWECLGHQSSDSRVFQFCLRSAGWGWLSRMQIQQIKVGFFNILAQDCAYITMAIDAWERQLGSLSLELRSLLEWTYVISWSGQPFSAVFLRNHSSLDGEAMEALWPTVARMLWKGILEYCERHHPAARRIIACGAVPHSSTSWKRPINDYRGSNIYIYIYIKTPGR